MNSRILEFLGYLKTLRNLEGSQFSVKSLEKSIEKIEKSNIQIISGEQAQQLFPGVVGKGTAFYINQILKNNGATSGIADLDNKPQEEKEKIATITNLTKIQGVGIVKAMEYFNMGIKTVEQLNLFLQQDPNSNLRQVLGAKYQNEFNKRIPRDKIIIFANNFHHELTVFNQQNNCNLKFNILGSFIRGQVDSGDIDVILFSDLENEISLYHQRFIDKLTHLGLLKEKISQGLDSYQGVAFVDNEFPTVRIDIKFIHKNEELPYAILYFTGSKNFNEYMRTIAKNLGYKLGNNEMTDYSGRRIIVRDEGEIFHILGIPYKTPVERN